MTLQEFIDSTIESGKSKADILYSLSLFLEGQKGLLFCDFDDTFIAPGISTEAYYRGHQHINYFFSKKTTFIPPKVSISSVFLENISADGQTIVIITRNFLPFVKNLIKSLGKDTSHHNINVVGIIGKVPGTFLNNLTSLDKLTILPSSATLVTDIFEYDALKHDKRCIFLPVPFRGPRYFAGGIHWFIKLRDYLRGVMCGLFGQ